MISRTISNTVIVVGEHDRSIASDTAFTATYPIASFIKHPNYASSTGLHNIALVKTYNVIPWNQGVGIVCLPFLYTTTLFTDFPVTVAGWGSTTVGGPPSNVLRKAIVKVISNPQCGALVFPQASSNNFMCTFTAGKGPCLYDSGTSAYMEINNRMYSVGVVSKGNGCATSPDLNTRVTQYLSWIVENSPDAKYCDKF